MIQVRYPCRVRSFGVDRDRAGLDLPRFVTGDENLLAGKPRRTEKTLTPLGP